MPINIVKVRETSRGEVYDISFNCYAGNLLFSRRFNVLKIYETPHALVSRILITDENELLEIKNWYYDNLDGKLSSLLLLDSDEVIPWLEDNLNKDDYQIISDYFGSEQGILFNDVESSMAFKLRFRYNKSNV